MPFFWQRARAEGDSAAGEPSSEALLRSTRAEAQLAGAPERGQSEDTCFSSSNRAPGRSSGGSVDLRDAEAVHTTRRLNCASPDAPDAVAVEIERRDSGASVSSLASDASSPRQARSRSDSLPQCLICLENMNVADKASVVALGCQCKGAAAYRHQECLDRWLLVKGNTTCDVCGEPMTAVRLPPPPPVPGYVVFPDLEHSFEVQWETFGRYLWHNAVAVVVYCLVLALLMDIKIYVAALIAILVIMLVIARYVVSVAANTIARRTVLSFQAPETS